MVSDDGLCCLFCFLKTGRTVVKTGSEGENRQNYHDCSDENTDETSMLPVFRGKSSQSACF